MSVILYLAGKDNTNTRQFCPAKERSDCKDVLQRGQLWKNIGLADLGFVYFCTQFLFLWIAASTRLAGWALPLLFLPAALALVLTIGLLAYQGLVIHRWCRMCLLITGTLWLQFIPLLWQVTTTHWASPVTDLLFVFPVCLCMASSWLFFKQWLVRSEQNKHIRQVLARWKQNSGVFWSVLKERRQLKDFRQWEDDLGLVDPRADMQFICLMSPFCKACAKEYPLIDHLIKKSAGKIGITIRFYVRDANHPDHRTQAIKNILEAYFAYTTPAQRAALLLDWYKIGNVNAWKKKWPVKDPRDVMDLIHKYQQWCTDNQVSITPSCFVNGWELPDVYKIPDLTFHLTTEKRKITTARSNHSISAKCEKRPEGIGASGLL